MVPPVQLAVAHCADHPSGRPPVGPDVCALLLAASPRMHPAATKRFVIVFIVEPVRVNIEGIGRLVSGRQSGRRSLVRDSDSLQTGRGLGLVSSHTKMSDQTQTAV
jgi:hypothetical protein